MTDAEFDAMVEAELAADFRIAGANKRAEIAERLRRAADKAWHDRVNQRHPIEDRFGGLTREQHAERLRLMSERSAQANREMTAANSKSADGDLRAQRAASKGGSAGFRFK
jgi:hypothetical protein